MRAVRHTRNSPRSPSAWTKPPPPNCEALRSPPPYISSNRVRYAALYLLLRAPRRPVAWLCPPPPLFRRRKRAKKWRLGFVGGHSFCDRRHSFRVSFSFFLTWERRGIHREGEGEREGSPRVSSDFGREDQQVVGVGEDDHLLDVRPGEAREDHLLHPGRPQRHYFGTQRKAPGAHRPGSSSLRATRAHSEAGLGARKADQSHPHLLFLSCRRSRDS